MESCVSPSVSPVVVVSRANETRRLDRSLADQRQLPRESGLASSVETTFEILGFQPLAFEEKHGRVGEIVHGILCTGGCAASIAAATATAVIMGVSGEQASISPNARLASR